MAYSNLEIRSFQGLFLQQNSFQVPDGAMEVASRIVIRSDEVITKTNGYYEYWRPGSEDLEDLKATYAFQGKQLGFFSNGVGYFEDTFPFGGTFNAVGSLTELESEAPASFMPGMDFAESNQNLYFTSMSEPLKLESFDGKVRKLGAPQGLGIRASFIISEQSILPSNSQTAYRAVFGRRDSNGNLTIGAPSDVVTVGVPAALEDKSYEVVSNVASVILTNDVDEFNSLIEEGYKTGNPVLISGTGNPLLDGFREITSFYVSGSDYGIQFDTDAADSTGTNMILEIVRVYTIEVQIPDQVKDIDEAWFVQLYRSSPSISVEAAPAPDFMLTTERTITEDEILARSISILDDVSSLLLGSLLYTNPNTNEGENQANFQPPKSSYITPYKGYMAYAKVQTLPRLPMQLVNTRVIKDEVKLVFKIGLNEEKYGAINAGNPGEPGFYWFTVDNKEKNATGTGSISITLGGPDLDHYLPIGTVIYVTRGAGTLEQGDYTVVGVTADDLIISAPGATVADTIDFVVRSVPDGGSPLYLFDATPVSSLVTDAEAVEETTRSLCWSINFNSMLFEANYKSQFSELPGSFIVTSRAIFESIYVRYSTAPTAPAFVQNLPSSFLDLIQYYAESDNLPNTVYISKIGEPEAVPVVNFFPVGARNAAIVGIFALKDSLIILKTDGVYKLIGDFIDQFVVIPIDLTVKFDAVNASQLAGLINNTVPAFSNQGIVQITENSVQIISRRIEDVIQPLIGRPLPRTFLFGHEVDRLFYIQTEGLNPGDADVTYIYNVLNQTWTSSPDAFLSLALGTRNELFGIREDATLEKNTLWRQRRTQTRVDWCGEYVIGDITVDPLDLRSALFQVTGGNSAIPSEGDVVLAQNIFNRIVAATPEAGAYRLTFAQDCSIEPDTPIETTLYKAYESKFKMAPFHAGQVSRTKHFAQMQLHLRQQVITDLSVEFSNASFGSSEATEWRALSITTAGAQGWGFSPWGLFPWGLVDGANLVAGTEPASIIRLYVPRFAARSTFIQPGFTHKQAGQPMYIQALSFNVHGYGERVSR